MNEKLINKYIPKPYRELVIDTRTGGMDNIKAVLRDGGSYEPKHRVHIEAIRGEHQGWSSFPDVYQIMLPNDDRIITGYSYNTTLNVLAKAHISAATGVVTLLQAPHGSNYTNKTLSEMFNTNVNSDATRFPFNNARIGDYAAVAGLQFELTNSGIEAHNPTKDYRVRTNRKISAGVYKELRVVADVVEGKGDMLRGIYESESMSTWGQNMRVHKAIKDATDDADLATYISHIRNMVDLCKPMEILDTYKAVNGMAQEGDVLSMDSTTMASKIYKITKGNPAHLLMSMILGAARENWHREIMTMAPIFIAARGGYYLKEITK